MKSVEEGLIHMKRKRRKSENDFFIELMRNE